MCYNVEETEQGYYVLVPEGSGEPLPALFDSKERAQRMARSLSAKGKKPGRPRACGQGPAAR